MDTHSRSSRLLSADRGGIEDAVERRPRDAGQSVDLAAEGVASSDGYGDPIGASQAGRIAQAFRHPLGFAQVYMAGFPDDAGFCKDCNAPYCSRHWHVSESGTGYCPRRHGRSLDPR